MSANQENIKIEKISELLKKAPTDDGTFYGSLYDLFFFIEITKGILDINNNKCISLEESRERMIQKYENYNRKLGS